MTEVNLFFFHGRPGSGKGTQIEEARKTTPQSAVVYPGEIIRRARNPNDSEYGQYHEEIAPYTGETNQGRVAVPPEIVGRIVETEVNRYLDQGTTTIFFDGFPRGLAYLSQKERANSAVIRRGHNVKERHINIEVPERIARERLATATRGRPDDIALDKRMEEHDATVEPMIGELRRRGLLTDVNGVGTVNQVRKRVRRVLV